ncbi:hypothetical protein MPER_07643 [Moniliophthora perniciosa FA553]|nr:hypothetical protein MPER_07643 [Moniliophthora perniciosa FA553]
MASTVSRQTTLGEALFNGVVEVEIRSPQYPYYLLPREIKVITASFRNITVLTMITSWCCRTFAEAVHFIASFPKLTHLACGDLLLRDDSEELAWHSLRQVTVETRFPNLVSAALVGELSPYTVILFMQLGPYPRLEALQLHVASTVIIRMWENYQEHVEMLMRELNHLTVSVMDSEQPGKIYSS